MVEDDKSLVIRFPEFGRRVQSLAEAKGLAIGDIKVAVGVGYEMARRYWLGVSKPDDEGMAKLAALLGVTPAALDWGDGDSTRTEQPDDHYQLPFYEHVRLSAGYGANNNGHPLPKLMPVPKWMLPPDVDPAHIVLVPVKGNSMSGELEDGAIAAVNTRDRTKFKSGKIYAYNQGDETLVKYFHTRIGGGILIKARNEDEFPPQTIAPYDLAQLDVVGRVVAALNRYWL